MSTNDGLHDAKKLSAATVSSPSHNSALLLLFALVAVLAAVCLGPLIYLRTFEYQGSPGALLPDQTKWPEPVRELYAEMKKNEVNVDAFEVRLVWGSKPTIYSTFICRLPDSPQTFEFLKSRIASVEKANIRGWNEETLPRDWAPQPGPKMESFVSQGWADGDEGSLWALARDPEQKRLFVEYYFNF